MSSKSLIQPILPPYFVEVSFHSLSSSIIHPSKHLRFSIFRNIQKLDQSEVISTSIKQNTLIKNKLTQPLIFKMSADTRKIADYTIVLYEVIYPVTEDQHLVEEEIGVLKMPMLHAIELYKNNKGDQRKEQTKDWLNSDIELSYLITIHTDYQKYNQYAKKKISKQAIQNEDINVKKAGNSIVANILLIPEEEQPIRAISPSVNSSKKSYDEVEVVQEEDAQELQNQKSPPLNPLQSENGFPEQYKLYQDVTFQQQKGSHNETPSSPKGDKFENLPIIHQQQQITDQLYKIKMVLKKIPAHKFMVIVMGLIVIILLSPMFSIRQKSKTKSKRSKTHDL